MRTASQVIATLISFLFVNMFAIYSVPSFFFLAEIKQPYVQFPLVILKL